MATQRDRVKIFLDPADGASVNFKYTVHFAYFADKVWSHIWSVAELSKHLQVADTANGIPEVNQAVGAHHQQSHVGPDEIKLNREKRCRGILHGLNL